LVNCQQTINNGNNTFQVDGISVTLTNGIYSNGALLASNLQTTLRNAGTNATSVSFNTFSNVLTFSNVGTGNNFTFQFFTGANGYSSNLSTSAPPANVLGFNGLDVSSTNGTLVSSPIDLNGPTAVFVRLTCSGEDLVQQVYVDGGTFSFGNATYETTPTTQLIPTYMGRIALDEVGSVYQYTPQSHLIEYVTPNINIKDIRVRMYWNNGTKLIPYDFGIINHMLKFEFECELDRLNKVYPDVEVGKLPPPIPEGKPWSWFHDSSMYIVAFVLFFGLLVLLN
jgi:hypothetical protein